MKEIDYVIWQEGKYYVSQCINVDVSSFGETIDEAISNLKEAVELYFEDENFELPYINKIFIGKERVNVQILFFKRNKRGIREIRFFSCIAERFSRKIKDLKGHIVIVPLGKKEIPLGTFRNILKQADITLDAFKENLQDCLLIYF